ncbi:MAG: winged helix-turn-helix transcriptional regulator [archaeon]|nr:winged helix-turn-helix transcriptional regulator [archaeon]
MDDIDITISMILMGNSRMPYSELAQMLNMSVNSVHKRVKSLVEIGALQNFQTKLTFLLFPNAATILMFGESKIKNSKHLLDKLGKNEFIFNVTQASGNIFFIHAHIENINQLDILVSFVRKSGEIKELFMGINKAPAISDIKIPNDVKYSKLDYLIIHSLKDNSRKTIADVSKEIGSSTKTIRRHLNRLIEKNLIRFTVNWYPDKTPQIISMLVLKLKPNIDLDDLSFKQNLQDQYGNKLVFTWAFSNIPNTFVLLFRTKMIKEIQDIQNSLSLLEFESMDVHALLEGEMYPTWLDTYLENKVKELTKSSK